MTYFGFLALFVGIPILIMAALTAWDLRRGRPMPAQLRSYPAGWVLAAHVLVALLYTTPWDNYLVATGVWFYDPNLVTGLTIGWVPIEEYTFFIVQPILAGLWFLFWARRWSGSAPAGETNPAGNDWPKPRLRQISVAIAGLVWLVMAFILASRWAPGTYLALQLVWALPPIMLQLAFGADTLWRYRRLVLVGLVPTTLYLALADTIAIGSGTWTIDPAQSLGWLLGGVLPIEEFLFFFLTNTLLIFGMTLVLASESQTRLAELLARRGRRLPQPERP
ncbi:MAG: lycopene cyclase domain-containing protein [Ardenticatenaceae bacterium]|nr:lycopene cyclase domain-containing protein [Anaerolineales bacterium]MCB8917039.1 lycopene cyclase domain-containing protein [Ardenticatenaceae bacterium]